jgi:hypothetical protein
MGMGTFQLQLCILPAILEHENNEKISTPGEWNKSLYFAIFPFTSRFYLVTMTNCGDAEILIYLLKIPSYEGFYITVMLSL